MTTEPDIEAARSRALIASLRERYEQAVARDDAEAKRALFKEAAYLGIRLDAFQEGIPEAG